MEQSKEGILKAISSNGIKFGGYINEKTGQVTNFSQF